MYRALTFLAYMLPQKSEVPPPGGGFAMFGWAWPASPGTPSLSRPLTYSWLVSNIGCSASPGCPRLLRGVEVNQRLLQGGCKPAVPFLSGVSMKFCLRPPEVANRDVVNLVLGPPAGHTSRLVVIQARSEDVSRT